jgi:CRP-like cAMP-binding protein
MPRTKNNFDLEAFLANIGQGRKIVRVRKKSKVYAQGDACDAIFYIKKGKIKLTVVSKDGKEATIAIIEFYGLLRRRLLSRSVSSDGICDCVDRLRTHAHRKQGDAK